MPSSLQFPLERQRDLERRWGRLLQRTATPLKVDALVRNNAAAVSRGVTSSIAHVIAATMPPRNPNDDDIPSMLPGTIP